MERIDLIPGTSYKIYQDSQYFSYGIDSILLSSYANLRKNSTLIDIGTGVGILALRCHSIYSPKKVYGIEIQEALVKLARKSVRANGLENIEIIHGDVNKIGNEIPQVDYIITNPPYMESGRGIKNSNSHRLIALYEEKLSLNEVFKFSYAKLKNKGSIFMVNRANRLADIIDYGRKNRFELRRLRMIHSKLNEKARLVLVELIKYGGKDLRIEEPLIIYDKEGKYKKEVMEMYYGKG